MMDVGAKVPALELQDGEGKSLRLEELRGKKAVLFFYPKDMTSGCTQEAQDFRDQHAAFTKAGAVVVGVSPDPVKSHAKFAAKESLPFRLLADVDKAACEAFGVWKEKSMYGRKYMGVERSTFVVGPDGVVTHAWRKVKVPGHVAEVLAAVRGGGPAPAPKPKKKAGAKTKG